MRIYQAIAPRLYPRVESLDFPSLHRLTSDKIKPQIHHIYIVFRDRDFDQQPTPQTQLLSLRHKRGKVSAYLTYRSCLENYLLNADLIDKYWQEKYQEKIENPSSKWSYNNSPGIDNISEWIETSARNIQDYQAVRWSLGELLAGSSARETLKTTWTGGSGTLPNSLVLQECKISALEMINKFRQAVDTVTSEHLEIYLTNYQEKFSDEEFWNRQQYLIWFHGKDLIKQMQRQENRYPPLKQFLDWGITRININQYPDLLELKNKIESL
ncbi:hypothetical protein AP285_28145 [Limnospira platensis YZ]|nr:hypothetical protein AP285_28145 [Arthrospira platensis YZ]BAI94161.1 hypothetical protein NIES39_Q01530 [Arthrospira platensis NIES-39]